MSEKNMSNEMFIEEMILRFHLMPISEVDLLKIRFKVQEQPVLIFKDETNYYISTDEKTSRKALRFARVSRMHCCPSCKRFSALPDNEGGCSNIRDFPFDRKAKNGWELSRTWRDLLEANRVEKYPYIKLALETINFSINALLILDCEHYKMSPGYFRKDK